METFEITMTRTEQGKDDDPCAPVRTYEAGKTYRVGRHLFRAFVDEMHCAIRAESVVERKVVGPTETKPAGAGRSRAARTPRG